VSDEERKEGFEYWLADMDDALDRFIGTLPPEIGERLDFSPRSLDILEAWVLQRYAKTAEMLPASESCVVDGLARYIGETFRKALGGRWEVRLDDPNYIFYGIPQLTGFWEKPTPTCPLCLATASADRRTGKYLRGVLENYLSDKKSRFRRA
jgi:hypothetical protein